MLVIMQYNQPLNVSANLLLPLTVPVRRQTRPARARNGSSAQQQKHSAAKTLLRLRSVQEPAECLRSAGSESACLRSAGSESTCFRSAGSESACLHSAVEPAELVRRRFALSSLQKPPQFFCVCLFNTKKHIQFEQKK